MRSHGNNHSTVTQLHFTGVRTLRLCVLLYASPWKEAGLGETGGPAQYIYTPTTKAGHHLQAWGVDWEERLGKGGRWGRELGEARWRNVAEC